MFSIEDLLSGRGRRMVLVVRIPSPRPPRLADFTVMWLLGGSMLVKFYKVEEAEDLCEDLAGVEAELAFHGLLHSSLVELFICGLNFLERLAFRAKAGDVLTVRVRRETCFYMRGSLRDVAYALSRAFKCEAWYNLTWAWR